MSNADFIAWRDAFNISAPAVAPLITQTPEGLLELVDTWENKVPNAQRCTVRLQQAAVDDGGGRRYNADTDWLEVINLTVNRWKQAGQYMVNKKTDGISMIEDEEKYLADSL
mgnify:CR=1 FL=1